LELLRIPCLLRTPSPPRYRLLDELAGDVFGEGRHVLRAEQGIDVLHVGRVLESANRVDGVEPVFAEPALTETGMRTLDLT